MGRSTDGGLSWVHKTLSTRFSDLQMIDSVGYGANGNSGAYQVMKTTNYGSTWTAVYSNAFMYPQKVNFINSTTGFILNYDIEDSSAIYKTTDGGTTWNILASEPYLQSIRSFGSSQIYGVGLGGRIAWSTNGGSSWYNNGKVAYDFNTICFLSEFTGFLGGSKGSLYKIESGGDYISKVYLATTKNINQIVFVDSMTGFIAGAKGLLKKTTNGGSAWIDLPFDTLSSITAFSKYGYYSIVLIIGNESNKIFVSSDTAKTWNQVNLPSGKTVNKIAGKYIGTTDGTIYKYNEETASLEVSEQGVFSYISSLHYFQNSYNTDAEILCLGGSGVTGVKSNSWPPNWVIGANVSSEVYYIFGGSGRNFGFGYGGSFLYSPYSSANTDISSWEPVSTPTFGNYRAMAKRTDNEYWIVGDDGVVNRVIEKSIDEYKISFDTALTVSGDTAIMDVDLNLVSGDFSSMQFNIYYPTNIHIIGLDTVGTRMGTNKWSCSVNGALRPGKFAAAGARPISNTGTLFRLKYLVPDSIKPGYLFTTVTDLVINNGAFPAQITGQGAVRVIKYGDVDTNGTVQAYDVALILKHLVSFITLTREQKKIGDVSKDGTLSDVDAALILRYLTGYIDTLPAPGNYPATGTIVMNNYNANAGQIINIPVTMNGVTGLMGFEGSITFDHQKLEFIGASGTGIASGFTIEHKVTSGKILVAAASSQDASGSGESVILQFRVKENAVIGTTQVKITRLRLNENVEQFDVAESNINILTGIKGEGSIPREYELSQNYPNPFNPETRITFGIPEASTITLEIFNSLGEKMTTLFSEEKSAGYYNVNWNAMTFPTGIYIVRMTATSTESRKSFSQIKKMVLVK
ncbi:MAG: T9SS type A sorting domain-containing protein [Ignavibacteriales bacterium]|nr:T9SS type A sorting domain-containing protein [Ignavibacteriales bacterium]